MMGRNPWLCVLIVATLGAVALVDAIGIIVLAAQGREAPGSLTTLGATAIGALASFLVVVPRGQIGAPSPGAPPASPPG